MATCSARALKVDFNKFFPHRSTPSGAATLSDPQPPYLIIEKHWDWTRQLHIISFEVFVSVARSNTGCELRALGVRVDMVEIVPLPRCYGSGPRSMGTLGHFVDAAPDGN